MSLREHMPYGAPDLIEVHEEHTWRATMLATALAVATLGVAHAVVSLLPRTGPLPPRVSPCLCVSSPVPGTYVPVAKVSYGAVEPVEVLPVAVRPVSPVYPSIAKRAGVEGRVVVGVLVGTDGLVREARVIESAPLFDQAALTAARRWVFTPGLDDRGRPVPIWVSIPFTFRLR